MAGLFILVLNSGSSSIKFSVYGTGDGESSKVHEGSVDGIGSDKGEFWIKDGEGKKLVDGLPPLPARTAAFILGADALHSKDFPHLGHRPPNGFEAALQFRQTSASLPRSLRRGWIATRPSHRCTHPSPSTSCARPSLHYS